MVDNSQDKGYITIFLKDCGDYSILRTQNQIDPKPDEKRFYTDFENGTIFVDFGDEKLTIGRYERTSGSYEANVYHHETGRLIGKIGGELICFCRTGEEFSLENECLAYYSKNGSIRSKNLDLFATINGDPVAGAAAFVATFYTFKFDSVFRDYFRMDDKSFKEKHASYFRSPLENCDIPVNNVLSEEKPSNTEKKAEPESYTGVALWKGYYPEDSVRTKFRLFKKVDNSKNNTCSTVDEVVSHICRITGISREKAEYAANSYGPYVIMKNLFTEEAERIVTQLKEACGKTIQVKVIHCR